MQIFLHRKSVPANPPNLLGSIGNLAMAGEQAEFTVEEMIRLLRARFTVETLIDLIAERLGLTGVDESSFSSKEYRA